MPTTLIHVARTGESEAEAQRPRRLNFHFDLVELSPASQGAKARGASNHPSFFKRVPGQWLRAVACSLLLLATPLSTPE